MYIGKSDKSEITNEDNCFDCRVKKKCFILGILSYLPVRMEIKMFDCGFYKHIPFEEFNES